MTFLIFVVVVVIVFGMTFLSLHVKIKPSSFALLTRFALYAGFLKYSNSR